MNAWYTAGYFSNGTTVHYEEWHNTIPAQEVAKEVVEAPKPSPPPPVVNAGVATMQGQKPTQVRD